MSNVWIINLKDNRGGIFDKNDDKKFNICKKEKFIAIGWVSEPKREQANYKRANKSFNQIKKGDYVWTKNPKTKKDFYLLEITDDEIKDYLIEGNTYFLNNDISKSIKVQKIIEYSNGKLPKGIKKRDIVAISTIQRVKREHLKNETINIVNSLKKVIK